MTKHSHTFVDNYDGPVGYGMDRDTDENTVIWYLQKFSDDTLIKTLIKRVKHEELEEIFILLSRLMLTHLSEDEYHRLFLRDNHEVK